MAKKKDSFQLEQQPSYQPNDFKVINLTEKILPVQIFNDQGKVEYLQLRIQGRGGQVPPVVQGTQITDHMRDLQKKKLILIQPV